MSCSLQSRNVLLPGPSDGPPLSPIRSLAYPLHVSDELLAHPAPDDYLEYLRLKLRQLAQRRTAWPKFRKRRFLMIANSWDEWTRSHAPHRNAAWRAGVDPRREQRELHKRAPVERQLHNVLAVDHCANGSLYSTSKPSRSVKRTLGTSELGTGQHIVSRAPCPARL